jgi:hypothetical protein
MYGHRAHTTGSDEMVQRACTGRPTRAKMCSGLTREREKRPETSRSDLTGVE